MTAPIRYINQSAGVPTRIRDKPSQVLLPDPTPAANAQFVAQVTTDSGGIPTWVPLYPEYIYAQDPNAMPGSVLTISNATGVNQAVFMPASGGDVTSVFGRAGNVVAAQGDYTASQVTFVPHGTITATNVQDAIGTSLQNPTPASVGALLSSLDLLGTPAWTPSTALSDVASVSGLWAMATRVTGNPISETLSFVGVNAKRHYFSSSPITVTLPVVPALPETVDGFTFTLLVEFGSASLTLQTNGGTQIYGASGVIPGSQVLGGTLVTVQFIASSPPTWYCNTTGTTAVPA